MDENHLWIPLSLLAQQSYGFRDGGVWDQRHVPAPQLVIAPERPIDHCEIDPHGTQPLPDAALADQIQCLPPVVMVREEKQRMPGSNDPDGMRIGVLVPVGDADKLQLEAAALGRAEGRPRKNHVGLEGHGKMPLFEESENTVARVEGNPRLSHCFLPKLADPVYVA